MRPVLKSIVLAGLLLTGRMSISQTTPQSDYLDSLMYRLEERKQSLDSSLKRMDRVIDSLTAHPDIQFDTLGLYDLLEERRKYEERQERLVWVKGGMLITGLVTAVIFWQRMRKRKSKNKTETEP